MEKIDLKIPLTIISSLFIAILLVYVFNDFVRPLYDPSKHEIEWYLQHSNSETKKIYLVGASHVAHLNSTHIAKILSEDGMEFELYNLWKGGERIVQRIPYLDHLTSTKPALVVIGIRYIDFSSQRNIEQFQLLENQPTSNSFFDLFLNSQDQLELLRQKSIPHVDLNNFKNPKLSSLNLISWIENKENFQVQKLDWAPITKFSVGWDVWKINDMYGIEDFPHKNDRIFRGEIKEDGVGVRALKMMIEEFKKNDIDVIVFSTPHHDKFRDSMTDKDFQKFKTILEEISIEYDVPVEFLDERYSDLKIWENYDHIARNPKALIYSEDVADIILKQESISGLDSTR